MIAAREIRHESVTIRHKSVTDSAAMGSKTPNPSQSVTDLSQGFCDRFRRLKSINNKQFSLSTLNLSQCHTHARTRVFLCARGACDRFPCDRFRGGRFGPPHSKAQSQSSSRLTVRDFGISEVAIVRLSDPDGQYRSAVTSYATIGFSDSALVAIRNPRTLRMRETHPAIWPGAPPIATTNAPHVSHGVGPRCDAARPGGNEFRFRAQRDTRPHGGPRRGCQSGRRMNTHGRMNRYFQKTRHSRTPGGTTANGLTVGFCDNTFFITR